VSALITARDGLSLSPPADEDVEAQMMIEKLLGQQLSVQDALRIAWVYNPRIRAEYSRLGVVGADVLQAGRLSNPKLYVAVLNSDVGGDANQVTFSIAQSFTDLLLLSSRSRLSKGEFERAKVQAGAAVMVLTRDVELRIGSINQLFVNRAEYRATAQRAGVEFA
jgi:outer membrane protein, heavy metal efflux system